MKISVSHIQDKPFSLHAEEPADAFPVLSRMQAEGECTFNGPVVSDITAAREYDHVRVSGRVSTPVTLVCSRCLANYETAFDSSFTIYFRKGTSQDIVEEEETELDEQDLVSATYSGDEIDLAHEIEEQVAMELPLKPLCSEECKGLCPDCGTDLNHSACSCPRGQTSLKFSALKDFKVSR
ncbi:MAG: DUF177 domain-containing protein [Deltaproteobacteria bacterium]|nr:DUF177 domain-containing protein [Deltaproteobacteria bacterium]